MIMPPVVELAGAPGSGKSSLVPAVKAALVDAGYSAMTLQEAARPFTARTRLGRAALLLPARPRRNALWAIFVARRLVSGWWAMFRNPRLAQLGVISQVRRASDAAVKERQVIAWFVRTVGAHRFLTAHQLDDEALVIDEGFTHRAVQLFTSPNERASEDAINRYVAAVPEPTVVIHIDAPAQECLERVARRGIWSWLADQPDGAAERFIHNAHDAVARSVAAAGQIGRQIVRIENRTGQAEEAEDQIRTRLHHVVPSVNTGAVRGVDP